MSACLRVCVSACLRVCVSACLRVCVYACMRVCVSACLRVCVSACLHVTDMQFEERSLICLLIDLLDELCGLPKQCACGSQFPLFVSFARFNYFTHYHAYLYLKSTFLHSSVFNHQDCSKRFTLYFPGRPVQSDTISTSLGNIQSYAAINARRLLVHIPTTCL